VPAGRFECHRIELAPRGAFGAIAGLLMPRTFLWYAVQPPHIWVKSAGAEGLGSREVIRELTRFAGSER
jgi:hypothetical protein